MPSLAHKRGTRAQIDAAASANALRTGEVYLITDESRLTVGTAVNAHVPAAKQSEVGGGAGFTDLTAAAPADPPAATTRLFRRALANRQLPAFKGSGGQDSALQSALHGNAIFHVTPASGTAAPNCLGGTLTTAATMSMPTLAATNLYTSIQRKRWQTAAAAASVTGMRLAYTQWWRGNGIGRGGFFWRSRFGQHLNINGSSAFHGLCASAAALAATAGSVAALINSFGVGYDTTDASTGNWFLYRNDGSGIATKLDLGANAARSLTSDGFELIFFCLPHDGVNPQSIWAEVVRLSDGLQILTPTEFTTDLPANTAFLAMKSECTTGAGTAATGIECAQLYIESDF
jgi:hypothetical protein